MLCQEADGAVPGGVLTLASSHSHLPAFAECPVRKDGDECEKGIHRSFSVGGCASTGFAEAVRMPRAEARGASLFVADAFFRLPALFVELFLALVIVVDLLSFAGKIVTGG